MKIKWAIEWDTETKSYNKKHKTNFKNDKELISALYKELGVMKKVAVKLYISDTSLYKRAAELKIKLNESKYNNRGKGKVYKKIIQYASSHGGIGVFKKMTNPEIVKAVGITTSQVWSLFNFHNIDYKRRFNRI